MKGCAMSCPSCRAENDVTARYCFACGAPLDPALAALGHGALLASRFEILGALGRGGMGMVYRAFDRELGETVAIKVLRPDVAGQGSHGARRFRSEIRLARRVRHRNVCSVYGDGEDRGLLYICMELVEGENLANAARERGGLPLSEAWDATLQVADGLQAIHEVGIIHRDLKTANLMRDQRRIVRVMDFGIAKQHRPGTGGPTLTASGGLMGTPEYMSPEQLRGEETDFRSDLYSLGVVIYELFTGELPFRGDTPVATILKQLQQPPDLTSPRLPEALRPVLLRALAKGPEERFSTAAEMRRALEAAAVEGRGAVTGVDAPARAALNDATRPLPRAARPGEAPIVRIALANLALVSLASHLLGAGGVRPQEPVALARPPQVAPAAALEPEPSPPTPQPERRLVVRARPLPPATRPAPSVSPRPLPTQVASLPLLGAAGHRAPPVDTSRVYTEDEVDVKPRRISGMSAPYPEWAPGLSRGERISITASFVVTEEGDVTDIRVEKGGGMLEAILPEISRWKYEPGRKNGVPVKVRVEVQHTFVGG
jgi:hypothetical protein